MFSQIWWISRMSHRVAHTVAIFAAGPRIQKLKKTMYQRNVKILIFTFLCLFILLTEQKLLAVKPVEFCHDVRHAGSQQESRPITSVLSAQSRDIEKWKWIFLRFVGTLFSSIFWFGPSEGRDPTFARRHQRSLGPQLCHQRSLGLISISYRC